MASGFDLSPEALVAARADVDRVHAALVSTLGDVRADVTSLVGGTWRGAAAAAFREGYDEWERGAGQVLDALTRTGVTLGDTRAAYLASDDGAADDLDRLAARLSGRLGGAI